MTFRKTPEEKLAAKKAHRERLDREIQQLEEEIASGRAPKGGGTGPGSNPPRRRPETQ